MCTLFCHPVTFHCGWRSPSGRNKDKSTLGQTPLSLLKGYYHQSWFYDWSRAGGTGVIPAENNNDVWDEKVPVLPACCSVGGLCSRDLMTFSNLHSHRSTDGPDLPLQRAHACLPCVPTNTFTHKSLCHYCRHCWAGAMYWLLFSR